MLSRLYDKPHLHNITEFSNSLLFFSGTTKRESNNFVGERQTVYHAVRIQMIEILKETELKF